MESDSSVDDTTYEASGINGSSEGAEHSSSESELNEFQAPCDRQILEGNNDSGPELADVRCDLSNNFLSDHSKTSNTEISRKVSPEKKVHTLEEKSDVKVENNITNILKKDMDNQVPRKNYPVEYSGQCDDLSYISDVESIDGQSSIDALNNNNTNRHSIFGGIQNTVNNNQRKVSQPIEEMEQLDFEAEEVQEKEEKEEGECEIKDDKSDEGELEGDDLEEGELTDEDENRPEETEPRPICRFYSRGQCTWGSSCRFVHPGVTDKGNYTMFEVVRPLVPVNGHSLYQPVDYRLQYEKFAGMGNLHQSPVKEEPVVFESAWERGLRQAKEMMIKSNRRKELDMDFEEKKMNLSLGQEELDKENDYYIRPASPIYKENERWNFDVDSYSYRDETFGMEYYNEIPDIYYHRNRGNARNYWRRFHHETETNRTIHLESDYVTFRRDRSSGKYHSHHQHRQVSQDVYEKYEKKSSRQKSHSTRIVTVEPTDKHHKDVRYGDSSLPARRGDEWADPWMRSKSPLTRKGGRLSKRRSHSSGSPHSSSPLSRSSGQSSHHSISHGSRSRLQSKKNSLNASSSHNTSSHNYRNPRRVLLPTPRTINPNSPVVTSLQKSSKHVGELKDFTRNKQMPSTFIQLEKKAASERALLMNPPPPSPQRQKDVQSHSPAMIRRLGQNPPPPVSSARSNSSVSSSGSDSSGSTSDSSESTCTSSSSSREPSPKAVYPPKRLMMEERGRLALAAESLKVKAMDALKLSGQKQQIKLTLKPSSNVQNKMRTITGLPDLPQLNLARKDRVLPVLVGKKRPAENSNDIDSGVFTKTSLTKSTQKTVISRREELLKQLKAVEDAIARKRSKI